MAAWMRRLLTSTAALTLLLACGPGDLGQSCQGDALDGDCVEGTVCTPDRDDRTQPPAHPNDYSSTCRAICETKAHCEPGFTCRRVDGSMLSSCQPTEDAEDEPVDGGSAP